MSISHQPSLEDLERMKELFEQMGSGFPPSDQSIGGLCSAHQELVDCLQEFDRRSAIHLISALETISNLHGNTIRIEVLLHLAVSRCEGTRQTTTDDLLQWIAFMDASPMASLEDPTEDVFIGHVCTSQGGFRVYQGIFSNADFILERLVHFLAEKTEVPGFVDAYNSVIELLRVSEAIADDLSQPRYRPGETPAADAIPVPPDEILAVHTKALTFDLERLARLGIDPAKLQPFHLTPERTANFDSKPLFGSALELHPLIPTEDGLIVASPSSLCRAAVVHILATAPNHGGWVDSFFETESAEFFVNEILGRLGIRPNGAIKLPSTPDSLPSLRAFTGQFDHGMPVLALIKSSPLTEGSDLEEIESFTKEQTDDFTKYVADCCEACESVEGFKGGLVLIGFSSVGRSVAIGLKDLRRNWHFFASGLADWQTLASDKDFNAKRLWYLGLQQEFAEGSNLEIVNTAGLLNLYAFWKSNDFALLHQSFNPQNTHNVLSIDGSYSLGINTELKSTCDRHCRRSHDGTEWVILQRQGPGLNPDLTSNLMYVDHAAASTGLLRGCVEYGRYSWWVEAKARPTNPASRSLLYRLWDCVFNWMERILPSLASAHPNWRLELLGIELEFPGIDEWQLEDAAQFTGSQADLSFVADPTSATVRLTFVESYLEKFHRPDNLAEREIVTSIIRASAELAQEELSETEILDLVGRVTKNQDTRFFHIVRSQTLESALGGPESPEPAFIPFEEISRVHIGLAHRVTNDPPEQITNPRDAQDFLDKIVASLQGTLVTRLKQLHPLPIVSHSFSQLDELSRDSTRWSLSTRSLLALEDGAPWLHDRLRVESGRLVLAEIANRALIETAVYSVDPKAQEHVSQTDHASLLAILAVMIELANQRDAIAGGFVAADIKIHPNGMVDYDETFQRQVFQPYLTSRVDDCIRWDVDAYDSNFKPPDQSSASSDEKAPEVVAFKRAFQAEFDFPYDALGKVIECFDEQAMKKGTTGGTLDSMRLRSLLRHRAGLTDRQADAFVERFILPIRPAWNRKLPKGCDTSDVLPWRYFRGLSVLVRPFVEVSRSPRSFAISASHLHRWIHYLTHSIFEGLLPDKIFRSQAMKSYLGSIADKKGHEFTKEVAASVQTVFPNQRLEINLTELGAPAKPDLGDIDVLAWDSTTGFIFLIECKRLKKALTVRQVIQQLEEFRGDQNEKDSLAKHQRRVDWLKANPAKVSKLTGIPPNSIRWISLLVTSGRVPMSFVDAIDFTKEQVIPEQELAEHLSALLAPAPQPPTVHPV